jgi:hypothetical protein
MRIRKGKRSTWRKHASVRFCSPQNQHDLTWDRTWVAVVLLTTYLIPGKRVPEHLVENTLLNAEICMEHKHRKYFFKAGSEFLFFCSHMNFAIFDLVLCFRYISQWHKLVVRLPTNMYRWIYFFVHNEELCNFHCSPVFHSVI